ncbi:MAG: T9SS C-terminal target domain-containing protein [Flavobacteriales bacterium]|nr:T9SS C-terminal target domain-containing protein [Flavobacteriales bacterium]
MKHHTTTLLLLCAVAVALPACKKKEGCTDQQALNYDADADKDCCCEYASSNDLVEIQGSITSNTTWTSNTKYLLKGFVYVENGVTLTIQAGAVIRGDKPTKGSLIIKRGGKIMAEGTMSQPIVFTSNQPVGQRDRGDWGGVIICGRAPHNQPSDPVVEGGPDASYGGNDAEDNSGVLRYVRIEFGGIAFQPNQEINGLTLGGVGRGTTIDHVQVSYSGDDSYEWFGGTVNAKNLIAFRGQDDDFDQDFGWQGMVQFALGLRDPNTADASGSNGFECDNDAAGNPTAPYSQGTWSNVTILGPQAVSNTYSDLHKRALHLRRNTRTRVYNSVFVGYPTGLLIDGGTTELNAANNDLQVRNVVLAGMTNDLAVASGSSWDASGWFNTPGWGNSTVANANDLGMNLPVTLTGPVLRPVDSSPLLSGAEFNGPLMDTFYQNVSFRGAFGSTDWTAGWANWDPQNTTY